MRNIILSVGAFSIMWTAICSAHNEYWSCVGYSRLDITVPPSAINEAVLWNMQSGAIPINIITNVDFPSYLNPVSSRARIQTAYQAWRTANNRLQFNETTSFPFVQVRFSSNANHFVDPVNAGGSALPAIQWTPTLPRYILPAPSNPCVTNEDQTAVFFNNTLNFIYRDDWWDGAGSPPSGWLDLQSVATHELGHMIGLNHCNQTGAIMASHITTGQRYSIGTPDQTGLTTLYGPPTVVDDWETVKFRFHLSGNYPNPFNPHTLIRYEIPHAHHVTLKVYNLLGQEIRTLVNAFHQLGIYEATWDGKDNNGQPTTSGMYIYTIHAGEFFDRKTMVLVK